MHTSTAHCQLQHHSLKSVMRLLSSTLLLPPSTFSAIGFISHFPCFLCLFAGIIGHSSRKCKEQCSFCDGTVMYSSSF